MTTKYSIDDDYDDDFGFSAVSEDELKERENLAARKAVEQVEIKVKQTADYYKEKLEKLYGTIMPLLVNLANEDDKPYIYWPNRKEKVSRFIQKVKNIVEDK